MAEAFPNSRFYGFDYHEGSIETARRSAAEAKLGDRVSFAVHSAKTYPAEGYDLVCFFDCLHDMGDPVSRQPCTQIDGEGRHLHACRAVRQ